MYNGGGGFTYWDIYNMPISDRKFNIKWIIDQNEKKEQEANKQKGEISLEDMLNKKKTEIDYVAKAATKK